MTLATNGRFLLGKPKEWVGCSMQWMTTLIESDNWEEIVGSCHAYGGTKFSIGLCIPRIYEPRETFGILLSPEITPLLTKPLLPYYPLGIPWAWTMGYKDNTWFCWIFNGFLLEIWTYILAFPYVIQGLFLKASRGHIKILGHWCWFFLLHIL